VRVKGDDDRLACPTLGQPLNAGKQLLMATVYAVETTDGNHGTVETGKVG
jgi:hypothetical protein